MREIKFRAIAKCIHNWSGHNKSYKVNDGQMVYGSLVKDCGFSESGISRHDIYYINMAYGDHYGFIEIDPETIGQLTGLSDQNSKEIYEGDIVKCISLSNDHHQCGAINIMTIKFYMGSFCFCFNDTDSGTSMWPLKINLDVEIIGNIYENQELLTNK